MCRCVPRAMRRAWSKSLPIGPALAAPLPLSVLCCPRGCATAGGAAQGLSHGRHRPPQAPDCYLSPRLGKIPPIPLDEFPRVPSFCIVRHGEGRVRAAIPLCDLLIWTRWVWRDQSDYSGLDSPLPPVGGLPDPSRSFFLKNPNRRPTGFCFIFRLPAKDVSASGLIEKGAGASGSDPRGSHPRPSRWTQRRLKPQPTKSTSRMPLTTPHYTECHDRDGDDNSGTQDTNTQRRPHRLTNASPFFL